MIYYYCTKTEEEYIQIKEQGIVSPKRLPNVYCFIDGTDADNYIQEFDYFDKVLIFAYQHEIGKRWYPKYVPKGVIKLHTNESAYVLKTDLNILMEKMDQDISKGINLVTLLLWLFYSNKYPNNDLGWTELRLLGLLNDNHITKLGKEFLHRYLLIGLEKSEIGNILYRDSIYMIMTDAVDFTGICKKALELITDISELVPYLTHNSVFIREAAKNRYLELKE
jgi:hypothetical protein